MKERFEVFRDSKDEWRFRLRARNGHIIAVSEGYSKRVGALKGIESVKECSKSAAIVSIDG